MSAGSRRGARVSSSSSDPLMPPSYEHRMGIKTGNVSIYATVIVAPYLIIFSVFVGIINYKDICIHSLSFFFAQRPDSSVMFERRQFPVKPAFAMTINKAQGQTLQLVGVYLPDTVFTHGQL